jgi:hypothetical protein
MHSAIEGAEAARHIDPLASRLSRFADQLRAFGGQKYLKHGTAPPWPGAAAHMKHAMVLLHGVVDD